MARQREKMWRRAPTSFRWAHSRPPHPSYKSVGCCLTKGATSIDVLLQVAGNLSQEAFDTMMRETPVMMAKTISGILQMQGGK